MSRIKVLTCPEMWIVVMALTASSEARPRFAVFGDDPQPSTKVATGNEADDGRALEAASGDIYARRQRIEAEIKSLPDQKDLAATHWARQWAGTYYVGDGTGMNVSITVAPKAGITYTW